jgi:hypothetical protein
VLILCLAGCDSTGPDAADAGVADADAFDVIDRGEAAPIPTGPTCIVSGQSGCRADIPCCAAPSIGCSLGTCCNQTGEGCTSNGDCCTSNCAGSVSGGRCR